MDFNHIWQQFVMPVLPVVYGIAVLVKRWTPDHTIAYKVADFILTGGNKLDNRAS